MPYLLALLILIALYLSTVPQGQGALIEVRFDVTRQDFEQGCATLFERALAPVTRLLGDLGESADAGDIYLAIM